MPSTATIDAADRLVAPPGVTVDRIATAYAVTYRVVCTCGADDLAGPDDLAELYAMCARCSRLPGAS